MTYYKETQLVEAHKLGMQAWTLRIVSTRDDAEAMAERLLNDQELRDSYVAGWIGARRRGTNGGI